MTEQIDNLTTEELKEMLNLLNAMTATSKGDKASDGKGKYLGDGLPRKSQYQLRTGTLALAIKELINCRAKSENST